MPFNLSLKFFFPRGIARFEISPGIRVTGGVGEEGWKITNPIKFDFRRPTIIRRRNRTKTFFVRKFEVAVRRRGGEREGGGWRLKGKVRGEGYYFVVRF